MNKKTAQKALLNVYHIGWRKGRGKESQRWKVEGGRWKVEGGKIIDEIENSQAYRRGYGRGREGILYKSTFHPLLSTLFVS